MTLKEKVTKWYSQVENITHRGNNDAAYYEAITLAGDIRRDLPSNHFRLDAKILEKYKFKGSSRSKNQVIEEWKEETLFDLRPYLNREESDFKEIAEGNE